MVKELLSELMRLKGFWSVFASQLEELLDQESILRISEQVGIISRLFVIIAQMTALDPLNSSLMATKPAKTKNA